MSTQATCSAIITFAQELEDESSTFYQQLAAKHRKGKQAFSAFAEESRKNKRLITRTYQETITDAIEACFIPIDLKAYSTSAALREDMSYADVIRTAIELEEKATRFYMDAADQSKSLLATIPTAFRTAAKRRSIRQAKLKSLLDNLI